MRVLLLEREARAGSPRARELARRHEVRVAESLAEALLDLAQEEARPDLVVTDLDLPDAQGAEVLTALQEAAWDVPILVVDGTGPPAAATSALALLEPESETVEEADEEGGIEAGTLPGVRRRRAHSFALLQAEGEVVLEHLAVRVADATARRTAEELARRLGLGDGDGEELRRAIRLARGFEHLKSRFLGALATGLGAALLLALANGLALLLRRQAGEP